MIAKIASFALYGLKGIPVSVEVDVTNGLPGFEIVGLADTAVKEAKERVRSALKNSGRLLPTKRITANFAPADIKKEGSAFDLPLAIGVLKATAQLTADFDDVVFLGELSLNGELRKINGVLPIVISAAENGYKKFIVPIENAKEASYVGGTKVYGAKNLKEIIDHLSGLTPIKETEPENFYQSEDTAKYDIDLSLVKGQKTAKRHYKYLRKTKKK